jgi:hypothetical protein
MGGSGSGNHYHWWRGAKKDVVEDCLALDAGRWAREGILRAGQCTAGTWRWTYRSGSTFAVHYVTSTHPETPSMTLSYSWTFGGSEEVHRADYRVGLATTRPRFGGVRWWFLCPLSPGGQPCRRRAGKLYLPPRGRYFGCRTCHKLTYTSCQESGRERGLARMICGELGVSPDEAARVLRRIGRNRP